MKTFLDAAFNVRPILKPSFDTKTSMTVIGIIVGIFIAAYAITIDPNDAAATIGIPP